MAVTAVICRLCFTNPLPFRLFVDPADFGVSVHVSGSSTDLIQIFWGACFWINYGLTSEIIFQVVFVCGRYTLEFDGLTEGFVYVCERDRTRFFGLDHSGLCCGAVIQFECS